MQLLLPESHPAVFLRPFEPGTELAPMASSLDNVQIIAHMMDLNQCKTIDQVDALLSTISQELGLETFLYRGRFHTGGTRYVERVVSNCDAGWLQQYEQQRYAEVDPTVLHAATSLCPLVWTEEMYRTESQQAFREEAHKYGLREGVTLAVHSKNGDVALLSLATSRSDEESRRHVREMVLWGSLLAPLTHESMRRIVKNQHKTPAPRLTKREIEVLKWVAGGKGTWEISRLIGISEHGVIHHVRNVLTKFDVGSRHQAVAKAMALEML